MLKKCQTCGEDTHNPKYCYRCMGQDVKYRQSFVKESEDE